MDTQDSFTKIYARLKRLNIHSETYPAVLLPVHIFFFTDLRKEIDAIIMRYIPKFRFFDDSGELRFNFYYLALSLTIIVVDSISDRPFFLDQLHRLREVLEGKSYFFYFNTALLDYPDICTAIGSYIIAEFGITSSCIDQIMEDYENSPWTVEDFPFELIEDLLRKRLK